MSLVAIFAISMTMTAAMADIPGSMTVVSASSDGVTHVLEVEDKIKQIPANKAPGLVTFWAFAIPTPADAPNGTVLTVDAITVHHRVNDHQVFDPVFCPDDKKKTCKPIKSSPVQSFHPHVAYFDENLCVIGLESPKSDFKVQHKSINLEASGAAAFAVATGTIGDRGLDENGNPICPVANLGITSTVTPPTAFEDL